MAELLVLLIDRTHSDPTQDAICPKRGDVIHAGPDGWGWGTSEVPPVFSVLIVPDMPLEQAQAYLHIPQQDTQIETQIPIEQLQAFADAVPAINAAKTQKAQSRGLQPALVSAPIFEQDATTGKVLLTVPQSISYRAFTIDLSSIPDIDKGPVKMAAADLVALISLKDSVPVDALPPDVVTASALPSLAVNAVPISGAPTVAL